ncbi:MAG: hypothetical protein GXP09_09345 [Gammaproteobacteria bacterium]|nr:hypothetical protein [Gammaproteobacteria bacterium]
MRAQDNLVRKQYMVSTENVAKATKIAKSRSTSASDIVRLAIDAYDPNGAQGLEAPEMMELVAKKLKEAIVATQKANRKVTKALTKLGEVRT